MVVFESTLFSVSQGWLTGWKVKDKSTGAIAVPNSTMKIQIGYVWMQIRQTKRHLSVEWRDSEDLMFFSFTSAVFDPSSSAGKLWMSLQPDVLADFIISEANKFVRDPMNYKPRCV